MGQHHYASVEELMEDNGVKTCKQTYAGLIAIHKSNHAGGYYWKYYSYLFNQHHPEWSGYYYTGSTSKFEVAYYDP